MKKLLLLLTFAVSLLAFETGELSFYLIKDGKPLANQDVVIFKVAQQQTASVTDFRTVQAEFKTDSDGFLYTVLPSGTYQLQVVAKDAGKPQAFVKKNFVIKTNKESQIIVSLKGDNTLLFADEEAPKMAIDDTNISKDVVQEKGSVLLSLTDRKSVV